MCCFTRPVQSVSSTKIFARLGDPGRQWLAYSMQYEASEALAMVLPIPTPANSGEQAVLFVDLSDYPAFFDDLFKGFPPRYGFGIGCSAPPRRDASRTTLPVVSVGSFDASFVPTTGDFDRLDERFRLPVGTWEQLPRYRHFGFAVFKLRPGRHATHPMALNFPTARPSSLFFPTVHIHDGKVHRLAHFDHWLFCQRSWRDDFVLTAWEESSSRAKSFTRVERSRGLINGSRHAYLRRLAGDLKNEDVWLGKPA